MEVAMTALPSVITKLGDLLIGEYNLQKGVKGEIRFLQSELESMKAALEKVSSMPPDQLDIQDKIWARDFRELSYDIEDNIDTFMVRVKRDESAKLHNIKKFIDRSVSLFRKAKIRHGIATEIKDIKSRVTEVHERCLRYSVNNGVDEPTAATMVDPHLFAQYTDTKELVGIDESRDELIKVLMDGNTVPMQQGKIVSIVGFGGVGKTTLAKAVYEKIRGLFDYCAFVSVSQTPDLKKLFKRLLYDLGKNINEDTLDEAWLNDVARAFLKNKRYLIVIDDIWNLSVWKVINCAFPDNDVGYIIITTTRNTDVAQKVGGVYKLKPLSEKNSRKLLYRIVFGTENKDNIEDTKKCSDEADLAEVIDRILKKCASVPLAIITMASLLACKERNKMDWYEVYHSIGAGLEHSVDVENMRKILSFSYYNMPSHLRTCLLYLSMFPEDYKVRKNRLIWMWIAEGFVKCEKHGKGLFELGESYFIELINRSMIQPIFDQDDMVYACRLHDMVLDLLCCLSSDANFVTILNGRSQMCISSNIRRLCIQNGKEDHSTTLAHRSLQQVRSVIVLQLASSQVPSIRNFHVLRVLDLQHCDLSHGYNLKKCLGNLFHLRYLGLCNTRITQLPEEIENMQFLRILDISRNKISCLPSNVVQLKHLMCLKIEDSMSVSNGLGNLTSLEMLSCLLVNDYNIDILEELGHLTELRALSIALDEWNDKLVECLQKLQKIQNLTIWIPRNIGGLDAWVAPRCLRRLHTKWFCWFLTLPAWMNPSHLPCLSGLCIAVREIQQGDLDTLGNLHALRYLDLTVGHKELGILGEFVLGAASFTCLVSCYFYGFVRPVVFEQGAMPRLRTLQLDFYVRGASEVGSNDGVGLDFGLGLLLSLQKIEVWFDNKGATKEEEEGSKAMLRQARKINPNHPSLQIDGRFENKD